MKKFIDVKTMLVKNYSVKQIRWMLHIYLNINVWLKKKLKKILKIEKKNCEKKGSVIKRCVIKNIKKVWNK